MSISSHLYLQTYRHHPKKTVLLSRFKQTKQKFIHVPCNLQAASAFVQSAVNHRKTYDADHSALIAFDNPNNRGAGIGPDI